MDPSATKERDLLPPIATLPESPERERDRDRAPRLPPLNRRNDDPPGLPPPADSRNLPRQLPSAMNQYPPLNGLYYSQAPPQPQQQPQQTYYQQHIQPQYPPHPHHHPYPPPYPHYPPPFAAQPVRAHEPPQQPPSPSHPGHKRKRKPSDIGSKPRARSDDDAPSESDAPRNPIPSSSAALIAVDLKKRTKTQRACDKCRSKKIRCDIIADAEPPICQHCKQYGFECTFFLPITETRFKKKKMEEEAAAAAAAAGDRKADQPTPKGVPVPLDSSQGEVKIYGPTSAPFLLHSMSGIPIRAFESYDSRYHQTWEVSKTGDGFIKVYEPSADTKSPRTSKPADYRIERHVLEELLNSYFTNISPMFPVVTQTEFLATPSPPPVLLYAMCTVAAALRHVPSNIFDSLRTAVNSIIKSEDVLSTASLHNLQALLILGMCGDGHSGHVPTAMSAAWLRIGTAFRMAQDLGLHRAEAVKENLEVRRRVWAACVISDRWYAATFGHPYMIDVVDCDTCLPTPEDPSINYLNALTRLSMILGRVLKTVYSPTGLFTAKDEDLENLLQQLDTWKANLPEELVFRGITSTPTAGLLHLYYACVCMMFWRVFMRITYSCPEHLKFSLGIDRWTQLVIISREAIDWLDAHEIFYDSWLLVAYSVTSCALIQYHTWARRKDAEAAVSLRKLRDCVRRWEAAISPGHMTTRRKTAEIISLIYEATQGFDPDKAGAPGLNPTAGVKGRVPDVFRGLVFKKDATRPGGGVYVATDKIPADMSLLPEGTIIWGGDNAGYSPKDVSVLVTQQQASPPTGSNAPPAESSPVTTKTLPQPSSSSAVSNVNPALNHDTANGGHVQVLNMLDGPAGAFEQHAAADHGLLDGIPGSMFDFNQWETFFSRFGLDPNFAAALNQKQTEQVQDQQSRPPLQAPSAAPARYQ